MGRGFSPAGYFSLEQCRESFRSVSLVAVNFFSHLIVCLHDFPAISSPHKLVKLSSLFSHSIFLIIQLFILIQLLLMDCVLVNSCN